MGILMKKQIIFFQVMMIISCITPSSSSVVTLNNEFGIAIVLAEDTNSSNNALSLQISEDGNSVSATANNIPDTTILYEIPQTFTGINTLNQKVTTQMVTFFEGVDMSSDGKKLVIIDSATHMLRCYSDSSQTPLWDYDFYWGARYVRISGDGETVAFEAQFHDLDSSRLIILNGTSGNELWSRQFTGTSYISSLDLSDDGTMVAVGFSEGEVKCFNVNLNANIMFTTVATDIVDRIVLSADGDTIVTGCTSDGNISLYTLTNGDRYWSKQIEADEIEIDLTSTGEKVAICALSTGVTSSPSKKVILYGQGAQSPIWEIDLVSEPFTISLSDAGDTIVGTKDGRVMMFDAINGDLIMNHTTFSNFIKQVRITNDGLAAASLGLDGKLYAYRFIVPENRNFLTPFTDIQNIPSFAIIGVAGLVFGGLIFRKRK
jgi:WD40 repeat protein